MSKAAFQIGAKVVDVRDKKAIAGTIIEIGSVTGRYLVEWPEGRFWQYAKDLIAAPKTETASR